MLERMKKKREARLSASNDPSNFIHKMARELEEKDSIDSELFIKHNVKRGLRNSNGTGVVVGLTRIGEVLGYSVNENKEKVPMESSITEATVSKSWCKAASRKAVLVLKKLHICLYSDSFLLRNN